MQSKNLCLGSYWGDSGVYQGWKFFKTAWWFSSVQSLSHVLLFATPWTVACQASLSFTISQSLLRLRLQYHDIVSMLSDPGKTGIKTVYEDQLDKFKGGENSEAQLASACAACGSGLCASWCTFWQCLCSLLVWIFSVLIILFSGNSVYIQGSINSTDS